MKVRSQLFLLSVTFLILLAAIGLVTFWTFRRINAEIEEGNNVSELVRDILELDILTYEFVMHHEERMQQQWTLKCDSVGKLLERMKKAEAPPEHFPSLEAMTSDHEALQNAFSQLQANFARRKKLVEEKRPQAEIDLSLALEKRIAAQIIMRSERITSEAMKLSAMTEQAISRAQGRANLLILLSMAGLIVISFCISFLVVKSITGPIDKLAKSAEIIGKGNLGHRVDIRGKNELAKLGAAFNQMAGNLERTLTTLDGAVVERREAMEALRKRVKEIRCLHIASQLMADTGNTVEDVLQGITETIPPSWQHPEVTCARITFEEQCFETENYAAADWTQSADITVSGEKAGAVEVGYLEEKPPEHEGPFLKEERDLIDALVKNIGLFIDRGRAEETTRRLATVVRDSNDAVTVQDMEGNITAWNRGAERMYGWSEEDALTMNIRDTVAEEQREEALAFVEALRRGELIESLETKRVTKDGRVLDAWLAVTKLVDDAGTTVGIATTERDITERKRAEENIRKLNEELEQRVLERTAQLAAANQELEAFSYSVSHDLRAPLRGMDGFSQALLEDYADELGEEGARYLHRVRAAAQRMGALIDDLLKLSRFTRSEMRREEVDLSALAREVAAELSEGQPARNVGIIVQDGLSANADAPLLRAAIENLLGNAWKFTSKQKRARIEFGAAEREGKRHYFVRDNGAGFDMAYADKLFGAFQRLHPVDEFEGTGIGLATVQRIVHRHGGRVWAEGEVGKGATFYFTL